MISNFVAIGNVRRFMRSVDKLGTRAAPEACLMLAQGGAGFGKTRTAQWWANQHHGVFIRIKAAPTPHWILSDLLRELGEPQKATSVQKLFDRAQAILFKDKRPIVLDEAERGLQDLRVLEIMRDISDSVEVPMIFVGRENLRAELRRHAQFRTRFSEVTTFQPVTLADVKLLAAELLSFKLADDLLRAIHDQSGGHVREVVKALGKVEEIHGAGNSGAANLAEMKDRILVDDLLKRADGGLLDEAA